MWMAFGIALPVTEQDPDDPILQGIRGELSLDNLDLNAYAEALSHPLTLREFRNSGVLRKVGGGFPELRKNADQLFALGNLNGSPKDRATKYVGEILGHISAALASGSPNYRNPVLIKAKSAWNSLRDDSDALTYAMKHFSSVFRNQNRLIHLPQLFTEVGVLREMIRRAEKAHRDRQEEDRDFWFKEALARQRLLKDNFEEMTHVPPNDVSTLKARETAIEYGWGLRGVIDTYRAMLSDVIFDADVNEATMADVKVNADALSKYREKIEGQLGEYLLPPLEEPL